MLKGFNWGRLLYVGWSVIGIVISMLTSPLKTMMLPSLVVFALIVFFLFRPKANAYFLKKDIAGGEQD
jgi:hypothetical protein